MVAAQAATKDSGADSVGSAPGDPIPHVHPMRSIENIYTCGDLVAPAEKLGWPG